MSVSDPLLKTLKVCTQHFLEEVQHSQYVSEQSPYLTEFCRTLEQIFGSGIKKHTNSLGIVKILDAYSVLQKVSQSKNELVSYMFKASVEKVKQHKNVMTNIGRIRLLIRYCIVNKCLHVPVECLKQENDLNFYEKHCILGDEILTEIFLSVLRQVSKINFKLDATNASFLDYSWHIPELIKIEVVPTDSLGISVSFSNEKAIIVAIRSNSILAEIGNVQVGDILDNLNGIHICSNTKGRLLKILRLSKLKPITLIVIKAIYSDTKLFYPPIVSLLRQINIDPDALKLKYFDKVDGKTSTHPTKTSGGHKVTYIGWIEIGHEGSAKQINKAARLLTAVNAKNLIGETPSEILFKEIMFEIGELGIKLLDANTIDQIAKHSYMEISSCGSAPCLKNVFAYVAGDKECSSATNFTCFVFQSKKEEVCTAILHSIGQGFRRTHYAV